MNLQKDILPTLITAIWLSLASWVQAQTQEEMTTILLPKAGSKCSEQTKLIIPKEGDWAKKLEGFQTCSEKLTIEVIWWNLVIIQSGNDKPEKWIFNSTRWTIEPIRTKRK